MAKVQVFPDATRTLTGLARQGYTPETAIADVVDNSIAAGANIVRVRIVQQLDQSVKVMIADNGKGMDIKTLERAMGIGSPAELANSSLSVYGMGMKTASLSFSRKFTVISKTEGGQACAASWDLDAQIADPWSIDIDIADERQTKLLDQATGGIHGTLVVWEKADFKDALVDPKKPNGKKAGINKVEKEVQEYLAMVFHRFMEGRAQGFEKVDIYFNDKILEAWDPVAEEFLSDEWTPRTDSFSLTVDIDGQPVDVPYSITTYLLKGKGECEPSVLEQSKFGMKTQGIYPYRDDRLLQNPAWLNVLAFHPDWNALRVVLELDPRLDSVIHTDLKKSGMSLTVEMYENLKEKLSLYSSNLRSQSKQRKAKRRTKADTDEMHRSSNAAIGVALPDIETPVIKRSSNGEVVVESFYGESATDIVQLDGPFTARDTRIQPVDDLEGGVLFEPVFQGAEQVIRINKSHPFYQKIYLGVYENELAVNGLDFLLYSMAHAELLTRTDRIKEQFRRMRVEMSNSLRQFVLDLDEPESFDEEFDPS